MRHQVLPTLPIYQHLSHCERGCEGAHSTTGFHFFRTLVQDHAITYYYDLDRYPTENLPNRVYERFVAKFKARRLAEKQKASTPQTPQTASCTKRSMEDFCVRSSDKQAVPMKQGRPRLPSIAEFADSVCSKMLSEQDRAQQNSPRKLTVKLTPLKSRTSAELKEPSSSQRRSSRNLLDYFSKK
ncbi:hypothetical protein Aduo_015425 [Ancylostoma duodenale]